MDYGILGDILPAVEIRLQAGEAIYTQSEGMAWMSDGFILNSNVKGGLVKGLGRMFSGEPLSMATYATSRPDNIIAFASTVPGKILAIGTAETSLIRQKGALLYAQTTAEINTVLTKKFTAGFSDGEGFIFQRIQRSGMVFLEVGGDVVERVLAPGEMIKVDTGNVSAFEPGIFYETEIVKGVKSILLDGEGLSLIKLIGLGKVYMQTMNIAGFTGRTAQGPPVSK